jgi:trypsin
VGSVTAAVLVLLFGAEPAGAVVGGQEDTANAYANVAQLQVQVEPDQWFGGCSGTLVAEDVVLTAAHCTASLVEVGEDGLGPADLRITFDPTPGADSTYYTVDHIVVHPDWSTAPPPRGNSKSWFLQPPREDVALVWLTQSPQRQEGISPAPIIAGGQLDELDLSDETFTVVGYGLQGFEAGSVVSAKQALLWSGNRNYTDVSVITEHEAFADRYVKITAGGCFGDSGGPLLHGDIVVDVFSSTQSLRCAGPTYAYRLDTPAVQEFLDTYL